MSVVACRMVLKHRRSELQAKAGVVATGIGYKIKGGKRTAELVIVCSVAKKLPLAQIAEKDLVPQSLDGVSTDVIEVGTIRALATLPTEKWRPAPGGVSIGHRDITAGTLGCVVRKDGRAYILSNNHVLANSNAGQVGDPILQPGPYDGGRLETDAIATLAEFVPITFIGFEPPSDCKFATAVLAALNAGCRAIGSRTRYRAVRPAAASQAVENLVDAALARPMAEMDLKDDQLGVGPIIGVGNAQIGTKLVKSGRTTGVTRDEVLQVDVTTQVQYGPGQVAVFADQIMAGPMSQGGDSGSAVLDEDNRFVGLLFAGSDQVTIMNRSANVLLAFGMTL